ncbi:hypothetical protein MMC25_005006 [Agyrium rufum]|nr:hypothetical protein [Agyrium rufum]
MNDLQKYIFDNIPQFKGPRLASLYSDLQVQRSTNPDGYQANISAWQNALTLAVKEGHVPGHESRICIPMGSSLLGLLETKQLGRPLGLGAVVAEGQAQRRLLPLLPFLRLKDSIYYHRWWAQPWKSIPWALRQFGVIGPDASGNHLPKGEFVMLDNLEDFSEKIIQHISLNTSGVDRVVPMAIFQKMIGKAIGLDKGLSEMDYRILLLHLSRDKLQISYTEKVVKIRAIDSDLLPVSSVDEAIAALKLLITDLTAQLEKLSESMIGLAGKAHAAVQQKNKPLAMASLRSKKLQETAYHQRSERLAQLEATFASISDAADQIEMVKVLKQSTFALKSLHAEIGPVDTVDDIVEQLRGEMSKVDEVNQIIGEVQQSGVAIDDQEIDDELSTMEAEQKQQEKALKQEQKVAKEQDELAHLPQVPATIDNYEDRDSQNSGAERVGKQMQTIRENESSLDDAAMAIDRLSLEEDKKQLEPIPDA